MQKCGREAWMSPIPPASAATVDLSPLSLGQVIDELAVLEDAHRATPDVGATPDPGAVPELDHRR